MASNSVAFDRTILTEQYRLLKPPSKTLQCFGSNSASQMIDPSKYSKLFSKARLLSSPKKKMITCYSMGTQSNETKEHARNKDDTKNISNERHENEQVGGSNIQFYDQATRKITSTYSIVYNDAIYINERVRNDIVLLSRGITQLDDRARQDVAVLGWGIRKLDARAREDTEKIDHGMKKKAARLNDITTKLKDRAGSKLKRVADQHWSDGALEADLKRADFAVRRRAMEDAFMALKFVRNIHDMMASKLYQQPQKQGSYTEDSSLGFITLQKNGKSLDLLDKEVSTDRINAIHEAYLTMLSALSEADGIDYTDPEELELLVAALIDLDAMDGKDSVSLLAECSSSPDVNTRQALANALAAAPSMWTLGNAGMGALQRLAQDINPAIAAAASKTIEELKQQWELEEGDSLRFMMNKKPQEYGEEENH